jgi:DNA polymerase sigma
MNSLSITQELIIRYPILPYIMYVLKKLLIKHNLNQAYHGGLNSYTLIVWIAAFVTFKQPLATKWNLGEWMLAFLNFFGYNFNPSTTGVCISSEDPFFKRWPGDSHDLVVTLDPVDYHNNISRSSFEIIAILKLFADTYENL